MQEIILFKFICQPVDDLFIASCSQSYRSQSLSFSAGKQGRAVYDRHNVDFAGYVADVIHPSAIYAMIIE